MKTYIGIDLGGTNLRGAVMNEQGEIIWRKKRPSIFHEKLSGGEIADGISLFASELLNEHGISFSHLSKVGIGIPGTLTHASGTVIQAPHIPGLNNFPIKTELEKHFSCKVEVDNDVNCITLGEFHKGAGVGAQNLCLLALGTGVGGGIVLDGKLVRGKSGAAGELGHMVVEKDGPTCSCGNRGCLETFCGSAGLVNILEKLKPNMPGSLINSEDATDVSLYFDRARKGETLALDAFKMMGTYLGVGLSSLVNIFNPEMIIITGGISKAWEFFIKAALAELHSRAFQQPLKDVVISRGKLGDTAGIIGTMFL
jgi:glucokinase